MLKVIDTHAHYDDEAFDADRDELLTNILETSVDKIVNMGCSLDRSNRSIALAEQYQQVFAAVGIHPECVNSLVDSQLPEIERLASHEKVVAIGEIGLDYHYEDYDREQQIDCFVQQLRLAEKLGKPVVIHSRDATEDTLQILRENPPTKAVMHCFSGSAETARELINMGLFISFTGVITFKNAKKAVSACEAVPLERLMLETDCPYMAPTPFRGKRCDSSLIPYSAEKIAEIKGLTPDEIIAVCNKNACDFFGI